jgi:hypothetical protein
MSPSRGPFFVLLRRHASVIARSEATKQSIPFFPRWQWIASLALAMTAQKQVARTSASDMREPRPVRSPPDIASGPTRFRHCEKRSDEAIHSFFPRRRWIASLALAMTAQKNGARNDGKKTFVSVIARSEATKQSILSFRDGDGLLRWRSQ